MYRHVAHRLTLRTAIALTICIALLPVPGISFLTSGDAQGQREERKAKPKPGKPEGELPDLEDIKQESGVEREAPPPIPSTIPSRKNSGKPWDGRRVGDPETRGNNRDGAEPDLATTSKRISERRSKQTLRAHARVSMMVPPPPHDQFVSNFFAYALVRSPYSNETTYWYDQFRVAYAAGATSLKLAGIELGRTLFESADYAARNRDAHWYVYDLYKTYLMREPDAGGWATWEGLVPTHGREYVRRGFEESGEFATLAANITTSGSPSSNAASLISARVDPRNQPGRGMLTRDASWSVPLLSLGGRAGLDLGLGLSYSSMVWTRSGPYIYFDEDNGFPSPGFRLGFPTVQRKVFDVQTAKNAYLMITAAGRRVELRHVSSNIYDAADSSYLRLTEDGALLRVHSTDGTRLTFAEANGEYRCTEVKDRNGNYITVNYNSLGRITTITDTLSRLITFNYDENNNPVSITQSWAGQPSHQWASFGWDTRTMQYSFSDSTLRGVIGTTNGTVLPVITQVNLNDTSHFTFDYTNSLQVSAIRNYFGAIERNATIFTYETPAGDAPRLLDSRVSVRNWTGLNGVPSQVVTTYSVAGDGACVLTAPDGTTYKEYYGTGWQKGLTTLSEVWSGGVKQKWTTTMWTQDNTGVSYEVNPRVTETNVYDSSGNRRRVTIDYGTYSQWGLPYAVREYAADAVTPVRESFTDYNLNQAYVDRRIIGLVSEMHLTNVSNWQAKTTYAYDDPARLQSLPGAATQHDTSFNTSFNARGNVTAVSHWDVTDITNAAKKLTTYTNYYTTGSASSTTDPVGHQSSVTYADSFSDTINRNTFGYPTTITDGDNNSSYVQYDFDIGATTRTQSPVPEGQTQGTIQTMTYNNLGQLEKITTTNSGAYKRFWYGADFTASHSTVNNIADELYSIQVTDGLGRIIGVAGNHPGSSGGYRLINTNYDLMGHVWKQSNPTEVNSSWVPTGDDAAGIYYTQQTYDWQGRPRVTTNPDGTTKEASYAGCGCAGGTVMTLTDEGTVNSAGSTKKRQQKIYSDLFGRTWKVEKLNWDGSGPYGTGPNNTVYATTVNTFNVRDQLTQIRQYAGADTSSTYQDTTMTYDGYGRVKTRHRPEQASNENTIWDYNADGTVQKITDGRDATTTYTYNNRHLRTGITYGAPSGIPVPQAVSYSYDAASNRTSMSDGAGSTNYTYDSLSRLTSESRTFIDHTGTYALNYTYNLADQLTTLSIPFRTQQVGYNYDDAGQLSEVTASGFSATYAIWPNYYTQNVTSFASNITYRASGDRKSMTYGNTTSEQITYNTRLQPATYTLNNMNYQNTNTCCTYPTYSTMTWTYGYYDDGRAKNAWDSTNEWFDRAYKYDHAGRLSETSTFRRARGLSPFPVVPYPDPYFQSITYDAFNHASRTGKLYTGEPGDISTYVNNRRIDVGWVYDDDGNITRDASYQHTFNAAGAVIHSVSHAMVGDGEQYPLQPRLDITQTYDGDGTPARRDQISRLPGIIDLEGNQSEPIEDSQTTYYVKSTVLGGATVVELGDFFGTVHIYANGQRIAREAQGSVNFEHLNPVTPSWVTSNGHSSSRLTGREERDSRGAEVPLSNPYAAAESYVDLKFGSTLFIEGGDPYDYSGGCTSFGMPISCSDAARYVSRGLGALNGIAISNTNPRRAPVDSGGTSIIVDETFVQISNVWTEGGDSGELGRWGFHLVTRTRVVNLPSGGTNVFKPNQAVIDMVRKALSNPECKDFMKAMLTAAQTDGNPALQGGNIEEIFDAFLQQQKGGLSRDRQPNARYGTAGGRIGVKGDGDGVIYSYATSGDQDRADASTIVQELPHLAGTKLGYPKRSTYGDFALAHAIRETPYHLRSGLRGTYDDDPRVTARFPQLKGVKQNPFRQYRDKESRKKNEGSMAWSSYVHDIISQLCPIP